MLLNLSESVVGFIGEDYALMIAFIPIIIAVGALLLRRKFDLVMFVALFAALPGLAPIAAYAAGYPVFTFLNHDLQTPELIFAGEVLIGLMCLTILVGGSAPVVTKPRPQLTLGLVPSTGMAFVAAILVFLFLENGNVVTSSYGEIKLYKEAPYSSLVNQLFNLSAAFLVASANSKNKQQIVMILLALVAVYCMLVARRQLFIGIVLVIFYVRFGAKLTIKQMILGALALFLLWFVGEFRSVGLTNFLAGERLIRTQDVHTLPGGASNVFVGVLGVIHLNNFADLLPVQRMPILGWPAEIYENTIYEQSGYIYNGGMHLVNVLYWNFGIFGVVLGGFFVGRVTRWVHAYCEDWQAGGYPTAIAVLFLLSTPSIFWYHPIGFIRAAIALSVWYLLLRVLYRGQAGSLRPV